MALTLVEAAKKETGDVYRQAVIETFAMGAPILRVLPFQGISGNALKYSQEDTLPGIGYRMVNAGFTESVGVLNPVVEPLVIGGGDIDVDKFIIQTMGEDQRSSQEFMKMKKLSFQIGKSFIKGDSDTNTSEFDGLQKRLTGSQLIVNDGASDALSIAKLDEAIDSVDSPTHLMMIKKLRRVITEAAHTTGVGGFVTWTKDEFGRQLGMYRDLPILIADENGVDLPAIDETEAGSTTSLYVLSLGEGMLMGLQNGEMDVRDLGELEAKPVFRTRIEWYVGMALFHPRAAARLSTIDANDAAVLRGA
jgi:hypothetical protein